MNSKLSRLVGHFGRHFVNHTLNITPPLKEGQNPADVNLNSAQIESIGLLNQIISGIYIESPHLAPIRFSSFVTAFSNIRKHCNGASPDIERFGNSALKVVLEQSIEFYPILLIKSNSEGPFTFPPTLISYNLFDISKTLLDDLRKDDRSIEFIDDAENAYQCMINIRLGGGQMSQTFPWTLFRDLVISPFFACCYRGEYSIEAYLSEVAENYGRLKLLFSGGIVDVSSFQGFYGFRMEDRNEFEVLPGIVLRNIDDLDNPATRWSVSTLSSDGNSNVTMGATMEIRQKCSATAVFEPNSDIKLLDFAEIDRIADLLVISISLMRLSAYPIVSKTFFQRYFPGSPILPENHKTTRGGTALLSSNEIYMLSEWMALLKSVNLDRVKIPMQRILSAIYQRVDPFDSVLDFFIAWESMFSSEFSTTKSVSLSISIMLKRAGISVSQAKISKLYNLRSAIVHGKPSSEPSSLREDLKKLGRVQEDIGRYAIEVFKQLLRDDALWPLSPQERVKKLLDPKVHECEKCERRWFDFSSKDPSD